MIKSASIAALILLLTALPAAAGDVINLEKIPEYLFVLSSGSGSIEDNTLTLEGVHSVVYFSDRPHRIAGHITPEQFVTNWGKGAKDITLDPPNATLSIFDGEKTSNIVMELKSSKMVKGEIQFEVKILSGKAPASFETSTLFVDPINSNGQWTGT